MQRKQDLIDFLINNPIFELYIKKLKNCICCFYYHGIENKIIDPFIQQEQITTAQLTKHILYLKHNGFEFINLSDLYNVLNRLNNDCLLGPNSMGKYAIFTFDDGYLNNKTILLPLMKIYQIPFTVFINTNHVTNRKRHLFYFLRTALSFCKNKVISLETIKKNYNISTPLNKLKCYNELASLYRTLPQRIVNNPKFGDPVTFKY